MKKNGSDRVIEYLGVMPAKGNLHAVYPTGLRTLCGIPRTVDGEFWTVDPYRKEVRQVPSCEECLVVVGEWLKIEGSGIPKSWKYLLRYERSRKT